MATHAIGSGSANMLINVPAEERTLWGRLAFKAIERGEARSVGDYQRQLMARGLEAQSPEDAARLREIRARYYASALAALVLVSCLSSWFGLGDDTARRSSVVRGVRLTIRRGQQEFEEATI